ncbi:MAG: hypothetical protein GAK38_01693 [Xylophilus sp.]|nr:MAG: hypothetical protein GAK38_01693 [Xylophilus sp.]
MLLIDMLCLTHKISDRLFSIGTAPISMPLALLGIFSRGIWWLAKPRRMSLTNM